MASAPCHPLFRTTGRAEEEKELVIISQGKRTQKVCDKDMEEAAGTSLLLENLGFPQPCEAGLQGRRRSGVSLCVYIAPGLQGQAHC